MEKFFCFFLHDQQFAVVVWDWLCVTVSVRIWMTGDGLWHDTVSLIVSLVGGYQASLTTSASKREKQQLLVSRSIIRSDICPHHAERLTECVALEGVHMKRWVWICVAPAGSNLVLPRVILASGCQQHDAVVYKRDRK